MPKGLACGTTHFYRWILRYLNHSRDIGIDDLPLKFTIMFALLPLLGVDYSIPFIFVQEKIM
jgi:hypothetical protein